MVTMTEVAKALNRQRQQEESYLHLNGGASGRHTSRTDRRVRRVVISHLRQVQKKNSPAADCLALRGNSCLFQKKAATYSPAGWAVPSARPGLTSLCGMGRGGTPEP